MAVPVGASSALQLSDAAGWLLAVPILIAALCAGAILASAARRCLGGRSEGRIAFLGVLLTATLLAAGVYEVLLYELLFCAQGHGDDMASLPGARGVYCGFLSRSGYWPAFVPAIVVLLTSIVALERGPRAGLGVGGGGGLERPLRPSAPRVAKLIGVGAPRREPGGCRRAPSGTR